MDQLYPKKGGQKGFVFFTQKFLCTIDCHRNYCIIEDLGHSWALSKPLFKNNTQTIFQGGTPWATEILSYVIVSMVVHCAQKNWGVFLIWRENPLKANGCQS